MTSPRCVHQIVVASVTLMLLAGSVTGGIAQQREPQQRELMATVDDTLRHDGMEPRRARAEVIVAWNELAHDIAVAEDQFLTFKGQRALAMMHLAMHDALNSIVPVYRRYAYRGPRIVADPVAAAAQAAYDVLIAQYPDQRVKLSAALDTWLATVPESALRARGVELGRATAAAILSVRHNDGFNVPGTYDFRNGPGEYQTTPPWNGFVAQPGFRFAKPFVLEAPSELRPAAPPALSSTLYASAYREVKDYGAVNSTVRSEDQTAYAVWWMEFAEGSVNRLARKLAVERHLHQWVAARLFAHIGMALFDTYVAVWDSKYEYNHWRPYTAIRAAETDANPQTMPDATWEPLRQTPPFPEYISAHAAACAASFGILERAFGGDVPFTMQTTTAPPGMPTRTFDSFHAAVAECADSRVRLGFHFRYSTDAGRTLGRQVARHTVMRTLQAPGPGREQDDHDHQRPGSKR